MKVGCSRMTLVIAPSLFPLSKKERIKAHIDHSTVNSGNFNTSLP